MEKRIIDGISYYLEYKLIKNINMHITEDGSIKVSAPYGTSKNRIDTIVLSKKEWYKNATVQQSRINEINNITNYIIIWGRKYNLELHKGSKRLCIENSNCDVFYPNENLDDINKYITKQFIKMISDEVNKIRGKYDSIILDYRVNLPSEFKYRDMTTRWGSCNTKKGIITLNTRLIHYPKECLEYVLLHEYMHLIVPNHSKRFHQLMDIYMPNNKQVRNLLNTFQTSV